MRNRPLLAAATILGLVCLFAMRAGGATPPDTINYQGILRDNAGDPLTGVYDMVFLFYETDGAGQAILTDSHVTGGTGGVTVDEGLYDVELGTGVVSDGPGIGTYNSLSEMFQSFGEVWLEVEVEGETLVPRNRISSVAYALNAGSLEGMDSSEFYGKFAQVVTVAKDGGDFTTVQAAIDSITDAAMNKPYLVWIAPGVYLGEVQMAPYIHLQGSGRGVTLLTSEAMPSDATLELASNTTVRDLTVMNESVTDGVAILGEMSVMDVEVHGVAVMGRAYSYSTGVHLMDPGTEVEFFDVWIQSDGAAEENLGLKVENGAQAMVRDSLIEAWGGNYAYGVLARGMETEVDCLSVEIEAENANYSCYGLRAEMDAEVFLQGGMVEGMTAQEVYGIYNEFSDVNAMDVEVEATEGSNTSTGVFCSGRTTLRGGACTASGSFSMGQVAGIDVQYEANLQVYGTVVEASDGDSCYAVRNMDGFVRLEEGVYKAYRGGNQCFGVQHFGMMGHMELVRVSVEANEGWQVMAVENDNGNDTLKIKQGVFTARGGDEVYGIHCGFSAAGIDASGMTVLAEGTENMLITGLYCRDEAYVNVRSSVIEANGWNASWATVCGIDGSMAQQVVGENNTVSALGGDKAFAVRSEDTPCELTGGSYRAGHGMMESRGIYATGVDGYLVLSDVEILAMGDGMTHCGIDASFGASVTARDVSSAVERGDTCYALRCIDASATLEGGNYRARDGMSLCCGIKMDGMGWFSATDLSVRAENGWNDNVGLDYSIMDMNVGTLRDVTLTAQDGMSAYGIRCMDTMGVLSLELTEVRALGSWASNDNTGLYFYDGQAVTAHSCHFQGEAGNNAYGIYLDGSSSYLSGERITAIGSGATSNYGLYGTNGATARVTQTHLEGATYSVQGTGPNSVDIMTSHLEGPVDLPNCNCAGITRENRTFYGNNCGP